jgi:hypothetical protein
VFIVLRAVSLGVCHHALNVPLRNHTNVRSIHTNNRSIHTNIKGTIHVGTTDGNLLKSGFTSARGRVTSQRVVDSLQEGVNSQFTIHHGLNVLLRNHTNEVSIRTNVGSIHINIGSIHTNTGSIHTNIGSIHVGWGSIHVDRGSIHVNRGSIHVRRGSIHVSRGSIHVGWGSIHVGRGSIHVNRGSIHVRRGSIHVNRGSIHMASIQGGRAEPISIWQWLQIFYYKHGLTLSLLHKRSTTI